MYRLAQPVSVSISTDCITDFLTNIYQTVLGRLNVTLSNPNIKQVVKMSLNNNNERLSTSWAIKMGKLFSPTLEK